MRWRRREMSPLEIARLLMVGVEAGLGKADFERFMRVGVQAFRGRQVDDMTELGEKLMRSVLGGAMYPEGWDLVAAHKRRGPHGRDRHVGAAVPGRAAGARARRRPRALHASSRRATASSPARSTARSCGAPARPRRCASSRTAHEDRPRQELRLRQRLRGRAVPRDRRPAERGQPEQGPRSSSPTSAAGRARASPRAGARACRRSAARSRPTAGSPPGSYAGLGIGLLKRSRKAAANTTMSLGSDVGLALGGIKLDVDGRRAPVVAAARRSSSSTTRAGSTA